MFLDRRFHPRGWIMLPEVFAGQIGRHDFLNVSTGERIRVDLPKLRHHFVIGSTFEGLIMLCQRRTGQIGLLNPLTQQFTALPNATSILYSVKNLCINRWKLTTGLRKMKELQGFSAGLADNSTVALHFDDHERDLAVAKPNDKRNGIKAVDVTDASQQPQLVAVKVDEHFWSQDEDISLVDNDGELLLLRPSGRRIIEPYDVHRVDLDAGQMVPMHGLRGRAVFVCNSSRSLSVHAGLSSSVTADAIYRCRSDRYGMNDGQPEIDVFHVPDDGWIEHDLMVSPGSIIDYLSRYVCRSRDIVVPAPLPRSVGAADALHRSVRAATDGPRKQMKRERKANPKVIGNEWVN
ncbi:hypothetical protein ACQ4PT_063767 [Festuca glaucescens]